MNTFRYYLTVFLLLPVLILRFYFYCGGSFSNKCFSRKDQVVLYPNTFSEIRSRISNKVHSKIPSPHAEILLGMTTGIDEFDHLPLFYDVLCNVGTVHVVVVSGFNITLLFTFVEKVLGTLYRLKNMLIAQLLVFFFALFSGFDPPVIRALIMSSAVYWGKYHGRDLGPLRILLLSAQVMLFVNPSFLTSLSFQLSFLSTFGLMVFSSDLQNLSLKIFGSNLEDLTSSVSATLLVWPLVSFSFGRVSIISPIVNLLTLWLVPMVTVLGIFLTLLEMLFSLPRAIWYLVYFPLDLFVQSCRYFDSLPFSFVKLKLGGLSIALYYVSILLFVLRRRVCTKR